MMETQESIETILIKNLKIFIIQNDTKKSYPCEFTRGTGKTAKKCGREAFNQHDGKWYCGKRKKNGEFRDHMGTMTKTLTKKKKLTKTQIKKIADENTQKLINKITNALSIVTRRAWEGGPFVYTSEVYGSPKLVFKEDSGIVIGVLKEKDIVALDSAAIKMCRALKIPYACEDEEEEINDESSSEDEEDEEDEEEEIESTEEESEEESDGGEDDSDGKDDDD